MGCWRSLTAGHLFTIDDCRRFRQIMFLRDSLQLYPDILGVVGRNKYMVYYDQGATTMLKSILLLSLLGSIPFTFASPHKKSPHTTTSDSDSDSAPFISGPPTRSHSSSQPHTPFSGTPSTTGALTASSVGTGISSGHVLPAATTYPSDGKLHNAEPAPYVPAGGVGTNGSIPVYNAKSDFDYESLVRGHVGRRHNAQNEY